MVNRELLKTAMMLFQMLTEEPDDEIRNGVLNELKSMTAGASEEVQIFVDGFTQLVNETADKKKEEENGTNV